MIVSRQWKNYSKFQRCLYENKIKEAVTFTTVCEVAAFFCTGQAAGCFFRLGLHNKEALLYVMGAGILWKKCGMIYVKLY